MTTYRFGTGHSGSVIAYFGGRSEATPTMRARIVQAEHAHDIAIVEVYGIDVDSSQFRTGSPVEVHYGSRDGAEVFLGYVNHMEPTMSRSRPSPSKETTIVCVGASWVLKQPLQKAYAQRNVTSIIREIAETNRLTTDVVDSDVVWTQLATPGLTQWQFLGVLAKRLGYTLYCHKTEVRCYEPLAQFRRQGDAIAFYGGQGTDPADVISVKEFRPLSGETAPAGGDKADRIAYGVDPRTGEAFAVSDDGSSLLDDRLGHTTYTPIFQKFERGVAADTQHQTRERLAGETLNNRFYIRAAATISGDVRVTQGTVIALLGMGDKNSGYWYVHEVEHHVDQVAYSMDVVLGRDAYGFEGVNIASGRRVLHDRLDPFNAKVSVTPPSLLVGGQWRSAYAAKKQAV